MSNNWKELYQYSEAKGFPTVDYQDAVKNNKVPRELYEQCIPKCFPVGAQEYNDSMMKCASNCKNKTAESYQMFKGIFTDRLTNDGYVMNKQAQEENENPFENMTENKRLLSAMKSFEVHTASPNPNYM